MSDADDKGFDSTDDVTQFGTVRVQGARPLPEVLDVLIAGGGPGGTAAAVRAKELGLSFLVIDYDDLMARIRDYPKAKPIKPSYGGGDKVPFPPGGGYLNTLHFEELDKDDMVLRWKQRYRDLGLNAKIGSEFTGLAKADGGVWNVATWNHRAGKEVHYQTRNVIVSVGAGVPRRFDIPGNTDGIAFRLEDAAKYVGSPALVIGGGTSAAEAVIAISNSKVQAGDDSAVYWSYRAEKLPKVSKALSEEFFDAYIGNGNVRYIRTSEPTAVVTGPDKREYLSVRIDRKVIDGRPAETVHLEFAKNQVVACIGTDLPFKFLVGLGVKVPAINGRPLMLVNREGEVSLQGVFLAGDARGPRYLRCANFDDSSSYEVVTQKRNIKAAMWDSVVAVEVIAKRAGIAGADVALSVLPVVEGKPVTAEDAPGDAAPQQPKAAAGKPPKATAAPPIVSPRPEEPADAVSPDGVARLVSLLPDGIPEEEYPLTAEKVTIGRKGTDIEWPEDTYMTDHHATLTKKGATYVVAEAGGTSSIWVRLRGAEGHQLSDGDFVWVGAQILLVQKDDTGWALGQHDMEGNFRAQHKVPAGGLFVGRVRSSGSETASVVALDEADVTLSRRHAQFRMKDGQLLAFDLGSTNGTHLKLREPLELSDGDEIRIASGRFRFEVYAPVRELTKSEVVTDSVERPAPVAQPGGSGPVVTIEDPEHAMSFVAAPEADILTGMFEYLKSRDAGVSLDDFQCKPIEWSCKVGLCGVCAVEIVDGADNFADIDPGSPELDTLVNKSGVDPDPKSFRLACLAKARGPVTIKIR